MTAMRSLVIKVPMPLNLANSRGHWAVKDKKRTDYFDQLDRLHSARLIPNPPRHPMEHALISSVMYLGRPMDDDNAMNRHKWVLDWLKRRRFIVDDNRTCLRWLGIPEQIVERIGESCIYITLTETKNEQA